MTVWHSNACDADKYHLTVNIKGSPCSMELGIGSFFTIVSWQTLQELIPTMEKKQLQPQRITLNDFQGQNIPVLGRATVQVAFNNFYRQLPLTIVKNNRPSLLGIEWFKPLGLGVTGIQKVQGNEFERLLVEFVDVFNGSPGKYTGKPISFNLDLNVNPIRLKP